MSEFIEVQIECAQVGGDYLTFEYEPGAIDGLVAGIDMTVSADGSITMDMDGLVALRDACNAAIESHK